MAAALLCQDVDAGSVGGDVAVTSDYIFRGISQGDGDPAAQADLHYVTDGGTFVGIFGSTVPNRPTKRYGYRGELETYLGHRFDLSPSWSTVITAVNYSYLRRNLPYSDDYQELAVSLSYLDRWTLSVSAAPNVVRYDYKERVGRYTAYAAELAGQIPLGGHFFATAGIGYYSLNGPDAGGYAFGNVGAAFEYGAWRIDAGYYVVQNSADDFFPYGRAVDRVAGTLSWRF